MGKLVWMGGRVLVAGIAFGGTLWGLIGVKMVYGLSASGVIMAS